MRMRLGPARDRASGSTATCDARTTRRRPGWCSDDTSWREPYGVFLAGAPSFGGDGAHGTRGVRPASVSRARSGSGVARHHRLRWAGAVVWVRCARRHGRVFTSVIRHVRIRLSDHRRHRILVLAGPKGRARLVATKEGKTSTFNRGTKPVRTKKKDPRGRPKERSRTAITLGGRVPRGTPRLR